MGGVGGHWGMREAGPVGSSGQGKQSWILFLAVSFGEL